MSINKNKKIISTVMDKNQVEAVKEIAVKLGVPMGFVIRRFTEEGCDKYWYSNNKQVVGSSLDPLTIS